MSQIRKIKILYTISLTLFIDIVWSFIIRLMFGIEYDNKLFLILLASAFGIQFIVKKITSKYISIVIPIIISIIFNLNSIYNIVAVAMLVYLIHETNDDSYYFSNIESMVKNSLAFLFVLGLFDMGRNIRLYVIFLIVSILLQRESRAFSYKMKNSTYGNLIIALFSLLFSVDIIFLQITNIFKIILDLLWIPISYVILAFGYVIFFVFSNMLKPFIAALLTKVATLNTNISNGAAKSKVAEIYKPTDFPPLIKIIIELAIILLLIFIIYKLYIRRKVNNNNSGNYVLIETEKIIQAKNIKRSKYTYGKDIKGKILYMFLRFEVLAKNKDIYKTSMTAKELGNKTKAEINKANEIDKFVNTYNEVKFSNHVVTHKQYECLKANYKAIKKEM